MSENELNSPRFDIKDLYISQKSLLLMDFMHLREVNFI